AAGNQNIIFLDTVKREYLMSFYTSCDVLYLSWRNVPLYKFGISANKVFEYMYARKPILMSCDIPNNLIEEAECGLITKPEDSEDIRKKIHDLKQLSLSDRTRLGDNGYNCLTRNFTYSKLANDYTEVFEHLKPFPDIT
ncbi:MAG: glycosyltransferase, partial [Eudoraea sp.]|nr:glycosyltransferase [Eudoraea sp.]